MNSDEILRIHKELELLSDDDRDRRLDEPDIDTDTARLLRDLLGGFFAQRSQAALALGPEDEFGSYKVKEFIGRGGFGEVWKVHHKDMPGREEALKVISPRLANDNDGIARFKDEVKVLSQLDDPHIVTVYTPGEVNGRHFFTMQYVSGGSLHDKIADVRAYQTTVLRSRSNDDGTKGSATTEWGDRPVINERQAAQYIMEASSGVACAHRAGIIHRDIKPGNLLLNPSSNEDNEHGQVLVSDFGLARILKGDVTLFAEAAGTKNYMAPEQKKGVVSTRSDVFALGATLFALLFGRPPARCGKNHDRLSDIVEGALPKIDFDLEAICLKCLQEEPDLRYNDAWELSQDLKNYLSHHLVNARPRAGWMRWLLGPLVPNSGMRTK